MKVSFVPHSLQLVVLSGCLTSGNLVDMKLKCITVLICSSLISKEMEYLFDLLATLYFFFCEMSAHFFTHFSFWLFFLMN